MEVDGAVWRHQEKFGVGWAFRATAGNAGQAEKNRRRRIVAAVGPSGQTGRARIGLVPEQAPPHRLYGGGQDCLPSEIKVT